MALLVKAQYHKISLLPVYVFWYALLVASLFISLTLAYANLKNSRNVDGPFDPYSREMYQFIANNAAPNDIIVFFKPRLMRLMTDRNSLAIDNCKQLKNIGDYIVINKPIGADGQVPNEAIQQCNLIMSQVFENPVFVIYKKIRIP